LGKEGGGIKKKKKGEKRKKEGHGIPGCRAVQEGGRKKGSREKEKGGGGGGRGRGFQSTMIIRYGEGKKKKGK